MANCVCVQCGKKFHGRASCLYDSDSCKQKAYRARRKLVKIAQAHTLTIEEYPYYQAIVNRTGNDFEIKQLLFEVRRDCWKNVLMRVAEITRLMMLPADASEIDTWLEGQK